MTEVVLKVGAIMGAGAFVIAIIVWMIDRHIIGRGRDGSE